MTQLTRKEREKAEHRREILEAAEAVFAQKGFHEAGVQEIAGRAEFSVGYLYNLFEHKTDLYTQLIDMRAEQFISDVEERLRREEDIVAKVRTAIAARLEFFKRHERFFLIFAQLRTGERVEGPVALPENTRRLYGKYMSMLSGIFAEGIRRGLFVDVEPTLLVQCMEGMINSAVTSWIFSGGKDSSIAEAEVLQGILFRGILAGGDR
ncbi:MAG: TetR/AcrR family transcriptional regulator [Planctomycetota bacterium]|jgi:AcrR family transcriptional regulator